MSQAGYERCYALLQVMWDNSCAEDREWFLDTPYVILHHELGRHLRNECNLWEDRYTPYIVDGVDHSPDHPDAVSSRAIRTFQENKRLGL